MLTNLMPDTRSLDEAADAKFYYSLYQLFIPLVSSLLVFIPTTLVLKEGKY